MNSFELSNKAKQDLKNIARYTEKKWGKIKRDEYIKQLDGCFHLLAEKPEIGVTIAYIHSDFIKYLIGSHIIFYKVSNPYKITIIRILHQRMDVKLNL
jgi:toxin ParE1/3/4